MGRKERVMELGEKRLNELYPNTGNGLLFKNMVAAMTETQVAELMRRYQRGEDSPVATIPNLSKHIVTAAHLKKIAKAWGISLWNHLRLTDADTGKTYVTPHRYMVLKLQICRLSQMQEVKRNIPESNRVVDELTGQVTGSSKGAAMSMPEGVNIIARGHPALITEFDSTRGGDEAANRQFEYDIATTGTGSIARAMAAGAGAKSTRTLAGYIRGMQLDTNLDKRARI